MVTFSNESMCQTSLSVVPELLRPTDLVSFSNNEQLFLNTLTSFPVDITAITGNLWTSTSVTPTVARSPISDGPMWVPFASTHSPRLMS